MNHPARRPLLVESMIHIPDGEREVVEFMAKQFPEFLLRALDILGKKIIYALGYETEGIYNFDKIGSDAKAGERKVKHVFTLDDGTVVKVV